jgi:hypothetical protein
MSLVYSAGGVMPLPKLAWDFNSSNVDYITSLSPAFSTVNSAISNLPTYISGKYVQAIRLPQTGAANGNTYVIWTFTSSPIPIDANGITISCWVNWTTLTAGGTSLISMYENFSNVLGIYMTTTSTKTGQGFVGTQYLVNSNQISAANSTGIWYHVALTYSKSAVILYRNGVGSVPVATGISGINITSIRIGSQANNISQFFAGYGPADCAIDDLRIFDRALTSAQVQSIYNQQGVPGRGVQTLAHPYDNVGITSSAAGLWSTRRLRSAYAGPVVNVRRNSDNATLDFIADQFGNLSNVQSIVTIDTWLTSTTGNVTTWYDQFRSNNFTQATATSQPQIVKNSGKWVVFFNRDNLIGNPTFYSRMTIPNQIFGIKTILFGINTIANTFETLLGQSGNDNAGFRMGGGDFFNGAYGNDRNDFLCTRGRNNLAIGTFFTYWYNNNKYGSSLNIVNDSNPLNQWGLVIGSTPGYTSFGFNSLSDPYSTLTARAFYGYLSEVAIFTDQISQGDAGSLYAAQYISRTSSTTLTGTPLFAQLSQSAIASAVGAFSLRAVNGTSAMAVRVKRSSDNAQQDFYADRLGNLLTTPVSGQTLQKWLGGAGGNVTTWYDQSGHGNNATGSGSFIYQTSNVNMQWAVKSGSLLTVTSPSTFITNTNFTIHSVTRRTTSSQAPGGGGTASGNQAIYAHSGSGTASFNRIIALYNYQGNRLSFNTFKPTQSVIIENTGCGLYSASGPVDYLAVSWNGTTTQMYYNGSMSASTAAGAFGNIPNTSNFTLLGASAYGSVVGAEFGEIIVFNQALDAQDISKLYSAR